LALFVGVVGLPALALAEPEAARRFIERPTTMLDRLTSVLGIGVLVGLAWLASVNRRAVRWKPVLWGLGLQVVFALIVLSPAAAAFFFDVVDTGVKTLLGFSERGADFLFQSVEPHVVGLPQSDGSVESKVIVGHISPAVKTIAFWILPSIIFFSSIMAVLYHLGVMQWVVRGIAWVMQRTMGTSGAESLSAAANIFVGQTEAPLLVAPFVQKMTRSELFSVMVGGFATIAGGVMATYVMFLRHIPGIAGHLVTASIMSAPAALAVAKLMYPEDGEPETRGTVRTPPERIDANVVESLARGASDGLKLALNVGAMLIAFVAVLALVDWAVGLVGGLFPAGSAMHNLTLAQLLGWVFAPLAWTMGVPWSECAVVGQLLGEKLVLTEFIAYLHLGELLSAGEPVMSERSAVIASYALCGFANFASIGIQIGGIGGIAPERRRDCAELGMRAMWGGTLAAFLTATIAGILI
jgi:CNT family concentrative nucleoside transporter